MYIQTSINSASKPDNINSDSRGTPINTGLSVAFNKSGAVKIGTIVDIVKNEYKQSKYFSNVWHLNFLINIKDETTNISKVKNPNSFVILKDGGY